MIGRHIIALDIEARLADQTVHPPMLAVRCEELEDHEFFVGHTATKICWLVRGTCSFDECLDDDGMLLASGQPFQDALAPWGPDWNLGFLIAEIGDDGPTPGLKALGIATSKTKRHRAARLAIALAQAIDSEPPPENPRDFKMAVETASIAIANVGRRGRHPPPPQRLPEPQRLPDRLPLPPPPPSGQWLWWLAARGNPPEGAWTVSQWHARAERRSPQRSRSPRRAPVTLRQRQL